MARITPSPLVNQIRGSIAGVTFTRSFAGPSARSRIAPVNPQSSFQTAQRRAMAAAAAAYRLLSPSQIEAWKAYATSISITNGLGSSFAPTAIDAFTAINSRRILAELTPMTNAPVGTGRSEYVTILQGDAVGDVSAQTITLDPAPSGFEPAVAGDLLFVYQSRWTPYTQDVARAPRRLLTIIIGDVATPPTFPLAVPAVFPIRSTAGRISLDLTHLSPDANGHLYPLRNNNLEVTLQN